MYVCGTKCLALAHSLKTETHPVESDPKFEARFGFIEFEGEIWRINLVINHFSKDSILRLILINPEGWLLIDWLHRQEMLSY